MTYPGISRRDPHPPPLPEGIGATVRQTRDDMDNLVDHKEVGFGYISESMYHMRRQAYSKELP